MNLQFFRYALEIGRHKSISQAAKALYVAQPNLSKAIRELEDYYGLTIFTRSPRGVEVTPEGSQFLAEAQEILERLEELKDRFGDAGSSEAKLRISIPKASYLSHGLTRYMMERSEAEDIRVEVDESGMLEAMKKIEDKKTDLAVIRYHMRFDDYFQSLFQLKEITCEPLLDFSYQLLVDKDSPLVNKPVRVPRDLEDYIEVIRGDSTLPSGEQVDISSEYSGRPSRRYLMVEDMAAQFDVLTHVANSYMWVAVIPPDLLKLYGVKLVSCDFMEKDMRDVIIYRNSHKLTREETLFLKKIEEIRDESLN